MSVIKENIDLKPYTYFKIGGPARYFAEVKSEKELKEAVKFAKAHELPFFIMGAASNILVADSGYPGVAIRMLVRDISREGTVLTAGAGVPNGVLVARALQEKLSGLEWAVGIPGSLGGSVRGNAGCFSGEMKDVVERVRYFNSETGEMKTGDNVFCQFSYRNSMFKKSPHLIIFSATLRLREGNPEVSQRLVRFYTASRTDDQDIGSSSAGCVFKNVPWPKEEWKRKRLLYFLPDLADYALRETIPVGFLIDRLGLKGRAVGKASISKKHANYIINKGGSTAEEVIMLIGVVKEYVHRKYDLQLEEEIQYVGF